jgi:hypothetical protein
MINSTEVQTITRFMDEGGERLETCIFPSILFVRSVCWLVNLSPLTRYITKDRLMMAALTLMIICSRFASLVMPRPKSDFVCAWLYIPACQVCLFLLVVCVFGWHKYL